ncbi:hypothetical protein C8N46_104322 [Kordia periserrulae]|uniref:Uncharacterized protein n=1 Tax=Kordia periserrulae TaxID=701523 RepID=A0A2T6C039_9FLAO|nr:hypothetical protein [Kordia periserrulae]PTX61678.1 hypothetical protein C8N46_104322 [Kordia periserrulae]
MSYIKSLKIATELFPDLDLQNASSKDIIRVEKLLKVEQKLNPDFKATSIQVFLDSLKQEPDGVRFLFKNENLMHLLTRSFSKMKKEVTVNMEGFERDTIYKFMSEFLKEDVNESVYYYFNKEIYEPVTNLLEYREILPDETLELIRKRTEGKIDFLLNTADKLIHKSSPYKDSFFTLTEKLDDDEVTEKVDLFRYLLTKYSLGVIQDRGIVVFFKTISKGLYWLGNTPKNIEEKIERKLVLKDFWLMIGILSVIFVLCLSAIIYSSYNKAEEQKQRENKAKVEFTKSLKGFLTEFDPTKATNIQYVDTLLKSGDNPFPKEALKVTNGREHLLQTNQFSNQTEYDIIILSYDDFVDSFEITPYRFLVKANDTVSAKNFRVHHLYVGKKLACFNSDEKYIPPRYSKRKMAPRFLEPYKNSKEIISLRIETRGNLTFTQEGEDILIHSDQSFYVNGKSYDNEPYRL